MNHNLPLMTSFFNWYPYGGIPLFDNFFGIQLSINHVTNTGAAWGFFGAHPFSLVVLRIILIAFLNIYILFFNKKKSSLLPLLLISAGAIGNVIDFLIYGHVIDMFHFVLWGYDFPVFNIADASISVGVLWLFLLSFKEDA